jgi:integrase
VPLSPEVVARVRTYLAGPGSLPRTAPLLVNSRGEKWTRTALSQRMAEIARRDGIARINVSAHTLRHTGSVVARRAGLDSLTRSALLTTRTPAPFNSTTTCCPMRRTNLGSGSARARSLPGLQLT